MSDVIDKAQEAFDTATNAMDEKVSAAVMAAGHKGDWVAYSAWPTRKKDDLPIDNLDEVAVTGCVRFLAKRDEHWGGPESTDYTSEVMVDPTWLQLAVAANAMIIATNDQHYLFLEGIDKLPPAQQTEPGTTRYKFSMGS